jgi:hypothetical protein
MPRASTVTLIRRGWLKVGLLRFLQLPFVKFFSSLNEKDSAMREMERKKKKKKIKENVIL